MRGPLTAHGDMVHCSKGTQSLSGTIVLKEGWVLVKWFFNMEMWCTVQQEGFFNMEMWSSVQWKHFQTKWS